MWKNPPASIADLPDFVGMVFELVAKRLFQGKLLPSRNSKNGDSNPDLWAEKYNSWIEVKSGQTARAFKIHPHQIEKYREMIEGELSSGERVLFAFLGHNLFNIWKQYEHRPKRWLAEKLVEHAAYLVVLDLTVVEAVVPLLKRRRFKSYGVLRFWDQDINQRFLQSPMAELKAIGLAADSFKIKKRNVPISFGRAVKMIPSVWILVASRDS